MNRRTLLHRAALAMPGLILGDAALEAFARLTWTRSMFPVGTAPPLSQWQAEWMLEQGKAIYRRDVIVTNGPLRSRGTVAGCTFTVHDLAIVRLAPEQLATAAEMYGSGEHVGLYGCRIRGASAPSPHYLRWDYATTPDETP